MSASQPAAAAAPTVTALPGSDEPIAVSWSARPGERFLIKDWMHKDTRNRFVVLQPLHGNGPSLPSVPLDELELVDKSIPDVLGAMRTLRDFKLRECTIVRKPKRTYEIDFMDMVDELATNTDFSLNDPLWKHHKQMVDVSNGATRLQDVAEDHRDEKMCGLALEADMLNYPAVPARFRTDELDAKFLEAKRAKRKRDEAAAEAREKETEAAAAEEARKALNREKARVRREAKKAKLEAAAETAAVA